MAAHDAEIASLKRELASLQSQFAAEVVPLRAEVAGLQSKLKAAEAAAPRGNMNGISKNNSETRPEVRSVQISHPEARNDADFPNDRELQRLLQNAGSAFPLVAKAFHAEDNAVERFVSAFRWARSVGRIKDPDRRHYLSYFVDDAKAWCQRLQISPATSRGSDIILAVIACNDIDFIAANEHMGQLWELALVPSNFGQGNRLPDPSAWRKVLAGEIRKPLPARTPSYNLVSSRRHTF